MLSPFQKTLLNENIMDIPIADDQRDISPNLTPSDLSQLINHLSKYIETHTDQEWGNSNLLYWLNYGLYSAIKGSNSDATSQICHIMVKLAHKNRILLLSMLTETIQVGKFSGQNSVFVWANELYSATFVLNNSPIILAINYVFLDWLEQSNEQLAIMLLKPAESGPDEGKNALLVMAQALLESARTRFNQPSTKLIADLMVQCIKNFPNHLQPALMQDLEKGPLQGKNIVYLLACILTFAAKDNPEVVNRLCEVQIELARSAYSNSLVKCLCKTNDAGPYKGLHSLHIMLTGLVSASYIKNNGEVLRELVNCIQQLVDANPAEMTSALTQEIKVGDYATENGIMMLVRSLIAASNHQMDATCITNLLIKLSEYIPNDLADALTHQARAEHVHYKNKTALQQLMQKLNEPQETNCNGLGCLLKTLASSPSAVRMMLSLSLQEKSLFCAEFSKIHFLTTNATQWLVETDNLTIAQLLGIKADEVDVSTFLSQLKLFDNKSRFFQRNESSDSSALREPNNPDSALDMGSELKG